MYGSIKPSRANLARIGAVLTAMTVVLGGPAVNAQSPDPSSTPAAATDCQLGNGAGSIDHVIYLQFDNTHFRQDVPGVPSDLDQMPHLSNFLKDNGSLLTNDHTILISHTAGGILSSLTGLYPDRNGTTVSNSYDYFRGDGTPAFTSAFKYWNNTVAAEADPLPNMVTDGGATTPAPWLTYTRAGCSVGGVSAANLELENANAVKFAGSTSLSAIANSADSVISVASTSGFANDEEIHVGDEAVTVKSLDADAKTITLTAPVGSSHSSGTAVYGTESTDPTGDVTSLFGEGSDAWNEAKASQEADPGTAARTKAQTDLVGIAVHCSKASTSPCAGNSDARPDPATIYPGSDNGFQGLFGAKYVNPAIGGKGEGNGCVSATDGSMVTDTFGQCGFPGFDGALAKNTLGEVEQMQLHGVPITYAYISDAHDNHSTASAMGPGEFDYSQQLADYDQAFDAFFTDLAAHGIDKGNTLFVVTVDEGDHFTGGAGSDDPSHPGSLTYTHDPCAVSSDSPTCPDDQMGEITTNLKALLPDGEPMFDLHFDDAPTIYVNGQPNRTDAAVRQLARDIGDAKAIDPYQGGAEVRIAERLADTVEEKALHMVNADPKRTPTLTLFGNDDFFFQASNSPTCGGSTPLCVDSKFAWNHGDFQEEIANTWLGIVGPGVKNLGQSDATWTDHTDVRPTINALLGVADEYLDDGRVITEVIEQDALPAGLSTNVESVATLGRAYKLVNAPFGTFGLDTLLASTDALMQPDTVAGNHRYDSVETAISDLTSRRDTLAASIRHALDAAASAGATIDTDQAQRWIDDAQKLLDAAHELAQP